jgi:hypothetical protein
LNEAPTLGKGEVIAITFEVLGLELPMFMEVQTDPSPNATYLLLGTGNRICANVQPSITKHEVFLIGVHSGLVAVPGCLHRDQQLLIE